LLPFVERLKDLNCYLLFFSEDFPKQLDQEEIVEALNQEKALERHEAMVAANIDTLKRIMKNPFPKSRD
jgi:hypothetical protein